MSEQAGTSSPALEAARAILRAHQRPPAGSPATSWPTDSVTDYALARHRDVTEVVPDTVPGQVRRGAFRYHADQEAQRIDRGAELIRRVHPGVNEDPSYFAMLAHQAASLEMAWESIANDASSGGFSRVLLGTAHSADVNAFSQRLRTHGYTIVVLNSGLVDFVYQAAKVVIEATRPELNTSDSSIGLVSNTTDLKQIRGWLDIHPAPVDRLYRTLEAYFFNGYPRAAASETVPEEQHPPLSLLVNMAERWMIGHEYAHGVAPATGAEPEGVDADHAEEHFADINAAVLTVLSAAQLDAVPPEYPLGGAVFALACLDIRQRAESLLLTGDEHRPSAERDSHPRPADRAAAVLNGFRQFFDVVYNADRTFDLTMVVRPQVPEQDTHGFDRGKENGAYFFARVLEMVWDRAKLRLRADRDSGRPLHPMWQ